MVFMDLWLLMLSLDVMVVAPPDQAALPASSSQANVQIVDTLDGIERNLQSSSYSHATSVDEATGRYDFDCSGMVQFVLGKASPNALRGVGPGRLRAVDFARAISRAPVQGDRMAWRRIPRIADALPGDVIAWEKPRIVKSANTGHVAFIVAVPEEQEGASGRYLVRITDASSFNHQDDTRYGRPGFGTGTIVVSTDPASGRGIGYGWHGSDSRFFYPTSVMVGRVVR